MNAHRMDQETAERLLAGRPAAPPHGSPALVALLTAVRATPRPGELAGEDAALHAYRMARAGAVLPVTSVATRGLAGRWGVRIGAAVLAVTATGGVAYAAATGTLPTPLRPGPATGPAPSVTPQRPTATPGDPATPPPFASAGPSHPEVDRGLCRSYRAHLRAGPKGNLDSPAFDRLVDAAGGRDRVAGYCDRVLADRPGRAPSDPPKAEPGSANSQSGPANPQSGSPRVTPGSGSPQSGSPKAEPGSATPSNGSTGQSHPEHPSAPAGRSSNTQGTSAPSAETR
ncbi:hypothetical protein K7640_23355 [Micromonospora sp. PLK6-60]|uniref:hypothetical protein n=1 Tax=Micromonospora sp. PLK6-60 TaxID=2873383 RepID=UPI001CA787C0|nr:hypothetical protein [Micromonospora sp. PLK6-60]MBY8874770.1 hypothetical protein [Micromonospora sp. PLK6-60]